MPNSTGYAIIASELLQHVSIAFYFELLWLYPPWDFHMKLHRVYLRFLRFIYFLNCSLYKTWDAMDAQGSSCPTDKYCNIYIVTILNDFLNFCFRHHLRKDKLFKKKSKYKRIKCSKSIKNRNNKNNPSNPQNSGYTLHLRYLPEKLMMNVMTIYL